MKLNQNDYREKVLGCWLGKNVGGTLGAPFEWRRQVNNVTFYTQKDLNGQPMPNDDLDIQLLWLCMLEEKGIDTNAHRLAEYWCLYVTPHWAEYGTAKTNMRQGLQPPLSGTFNNVYKHSCGSFIRSEIWACIAPGLPHVAAKYAYEDAILDHGNGEGVYAEVFMAALESAAFVISDLRRLIDIGLSFIPADCGVARAVKTTLGCYDSGMKWRETRDEILRHHRGSSPFNIAEFSSPEDREKGFHEGVLGYDVPSNVAITLVGLLWGNEDFGQVQCIAVNCGEDTDCTAATAGSIWGIIHGAKAVPQKWIDPIGRDIKTVCLNLGELGYFGDQLPRTVDELTDRTVRIARQVLAREKAENFCSPEPTDLGDAKEWNPKPTDEGRSIWGGFNGPRFDFDFFTVQVDFGGADPVIRDGAPTKLTIRITNNYKVQGNLTLHWHLPEGWKVSPSADGYAMLFPGALGKPLALEYTFTTDRVTRSTNRAVLEITLEGRPTTMLVPIVLLNGNLTP
jgi:ADP-ribosylglycohydrolase